jgi:hypothetical protein
MANEVYANDNEVACKAAAGKSICASPDVCMTPPENPATPPGVPVPYPNTGLARDTTDGSRTVKISGKEVMLKNKSYFKTSYGDEAGCAAKKGVLTSTNRGKVYFIAWSMDVKVEGENADRHLDMTTHNHASPMANEAAPMVYNDKAARKAGWTCQDFVNDEREKCNTGQEKQLMMVRFTENGKEQERGFYASELLPDGTISGRPGAQVSPATKNKKNPRPAGKANCSEECKEAQACVLAPKGDDKTFCCTPNTTGHHIIPGHTFEGVPNYVYENAPCVCVEGTNQHGPGNHGKMHAFQDYLEKCRVKLFEIGFLKPGKYTKEKPLSYAEVKAGGLDAHAQVFKSSGCKRECLEAQLDQFHKHLINNDESTPVASEAGSFKNWNQDRIDRGRNALQQNLNDKGFGHVLKF